MKVSEVKKESLQVNSLAGVWWGSNARSRLEQKRECCGLALTRQHKTGFCCRKELKPIAQIRTDLYCEGKQELISLFIVFETFLFGKSCDLRLQPAAWSGVVCWCTGALLAHILRSLPI